MTGNVLSHILSLFSEIKDNYNINYVICNHRRKSVFYFHQQLPTICNHGFWKINEVSHSTGFLVSFNTFPSELFIAKPDDKIPSPYVFVIILF